MILAFLAFEMFPAKSMSVNRRTKLPFGYFCLTIGANSSLMLLAKAWAVKFASRPPMLKSVNLAGLTNCMVTGSTAAPDTEPAKVAVNQRHIHGKKFDLFINESFC